MKNYRLIIPSILLGLFSVSSMADTSAISYEHNYRTYNRVHSDRLYINYGFSNCLYLGVGVNLINKKNDTLDDVVSYSNIFDIHYRYHVNDKFSVTPLLRAKFYTGVGDDHDYTGEISDPGNSGARYMPGVKLNYTWGPKLSLFAKYNYEIRKFSHKKGKSRLSTRHRNALMVGGDYHLSDALLVSYAFTFKHANYVLYDNRKSNYEQRLKVAYRAGDHWQPYLGVEDKAASTERNTREARLTAGFNYSF
ncbi:MAG: hypothetical protein CENE_00802 [Candidatus Celerinatantimonas neptuna]|nr:MAG: hypothetical protein CENE_00802 [Candidatus Celerinatantimonas neptuna]